MLLLLLGAALGAKPLIGFHSCAAIHAEFLLGLCQSSIRCAALGAEFLPWVEFGVAALALHYTAPVQKVQFLGVVLGTRLGVDLFAAGEGLLGG